MTALDPIKKQAELLAQDNREAEPTIERIYWFPDEKEVRLVELTSIVPANGDDRLRPFYFPPSPVDSLPVSSSVAMIRPEEWGVLKLPAGWRYEQAVLISNGKHP